MTIQVGDRLPEATLRFLGEDGPDEVQLSTKLKGRRVVIFSLPGAFTKTCTAAHMPSFVRTADAFRAAGIDEIICIAVNDIQVLDAWGHHTGATKAGISILGDCDGAYTKSIGLSFDAPPVGYYGRPVRHAMVVNDGVVEVLQIEESRSVCEMTAGETLLEMV